MHIDLDILLFAIIAIVLLGKLWSVLGNRNEEDQPRPNPFPPQESVKPDEPFAAGGGQQPASPYAQIASQLRMAPPPASLAGGLAAVAAIDPTFNEKQFLQTAGDLFSVIVGAYAAGTLDTVSDVISPALRAHFETAIEARKSMGQTAQSRVAKITEADPIAARAEGGTAYVTVKFISEQENILRDASGAVIGGEEGKTETVTDIWTFARDTQRLDGKWMLVETRG